jgi:hypothetical protein
MKMLFILALIGASFITNAQKLDFGLSAGTGKSYIIEDLDNSVNVAYGMPLSLMSELKYTPKGKKWGVKLRLHNIESTVMGTNWTDHTSLDGYANTFTASLLLENEVKLKRASYGFSAGLGLTKETIQPLQYYNYKVTNNYTSISLGSYLCLRMGKSFNFQIQPVLLWQDPFKSIGVITKMRNANFAGEDLTAVINVGVRYRLWKGDSKRKEN